MLPFLILMSGLVAVAAYAKIKTSPTEPKD